MLDPSALRSLRPFVATPSHSGTMHTAYVRSLLGLVNAAWTHGFPMQTRFLDGDSLIPRARNRLVAEFMADDRWTHLFFIDADIGFEPEAALRLLLAGRDVVAGAYPLKTDGWPDAGLAAPLPAGSTRADFEARHASFPINLLPGAPHTMEAGQVGRLAHSTRVDADGFLPVAHAPAGFMLIARGAFERLAQARPDLRYSPEGVAGGAAEIDWPHHRFFDVLAEPGNGRYLSEDFAFCERWRGIGGEVFVDTQSALVHHGTRAYGGHLGRALAIGRG